MGKYSKKIVELLESDDAENFDEWLKQQPLQDQPDIMREMKNYAQQKAIENEHYWLLSKLDGFDEKIDDFENSVIDELAIRQQMEQNEKEIERLSRELLESYLKLQNHIIEGVLKQDENSQDFLDFAKKMIENEKQHNLYDEEDWERILHLL